MDYSKIKEILSDYKLPPKTKGRTLNKHQRLALEIIEYCDPMTKDYQKRWFGICKRCPAFVEDKFLTFKNSGIKDGAYFYRMIYKNKLCALKRISRNI